MDRIVGIMKKYHQRYGYGRLRVVAGWLELECGCGRLSKMAVARRSTVQEAGVDVSVRYIDTNYSRPRGCCIVL